MVPVVEDGSSGSRRRAGSVECDPRIEGRCHGSLFTGMVNSHSFLVILHCIWLSSLVTERITKSSDYEE